MAKKKKYKVLIGFNAESGDRFEIDEIVAADRLTPADIKALIEMDAVEEVK